MFVIGLPRSGTTFLHNLLTQDPRNRSPLTWEIMFPSPPPERADAGATTRASRCARRSSPRSVSSTKACKAIHPFGARRPEECNFIWEYTLRTVNYMAWWNVPTYTKLLYSSDMRPVYEAHKRFLQHLQHRHAGDRWVLKTPAHMAWLDTLLAVYPDACLIQCHRDPAKIIPSLANNLLQYRKLYSTLRPAGSYGMLELQADSLRKVDAIRARPEFTGRFVDAHYTDVQADPMAVVRRIYQHFDMPLPADERGRDDALAEPRPQRSRERPAPRIQRAGVRRSTTPRSTVISATTSVATTSHWSADVRRPVSAAGADARKRCAEPVTLTHLQRLEAESIHIMREVVAECERPVMLYSIGKDSSVMLHLAMKAFYPSKPPFPLLHVDTTWKFREMIAFRDRDGERARPRAARPHQPRSGGAWASTRSRTARRCTPT